MQSGSSSAAAGPSGAGGSPVVVLLDDDDGDGDDESDVEEVAPPRPSGPQTLDGEVLDEDEGLELVGSSGGLLAADLPHARAECPRKRFTSSKTAKRTLPGNDEHCPNCWCYVCEMPVARCGQWSSRDTSQPAHCNAHGLSPFWASFRSKAKRQRPA